MHEQRPMDNLRHYLRACQQQATDPNQVQKLRATGQPALMREVRRQLKRAVDLLVEEGVEYKRAKVLNLLPEFLESAPGTKTSCPPLADDPRPYGIHDENCDASFQLQPCEMPCAGLAAGSDVFQTPIREQKRQVTPAKTPSKLFSSSLFGSPTPLKRGLFPTPPGSDCFSPWNGLDFSPFLTSQSKDMSVHQLLQFTPQKLCFEEHSPRAARLDTQSDSLGTLDSKLSSPPSVVKAAKDFSGCFNASKPSSPCASLEAASPGGLLLSCRSPGLPPCPDLFLPSDSKPGSGLLLEPLHSKSGSAHLLEPLHSKPGSGHLLEPLHSRPGSGNLLEPLHCRPGSGALLEPLQPLHCKTEALHSRPGSGSLLEPLPPLHSRADPLHSRSGSMNLLEPLHSRPGSGNLLEPLPSSRHHVEAQRPLVTDLENLPCWPHLPRYVSVPLDKPGLDNLPDKQDALGLPPLPTPVLKSEHHLEHISTEAVTTPWTRAPLLGTNFSNSASGNLAAPGHVQLSPLQFPLDLFEAQYGGNC